MSEAVAISVTQLNAYMKALVEQDALLSEVCVRGEISNCKHHSAGHFYFSLKDSDAAVSAVMFRGNASRLTFVPKDGTKVVAYGRISIYEKTGQYQIYVSAMQEDGVGDLYRAYEALKRRLEAEGLFAPERKKPLPAMPRRIGIITSPTGAAIRDMLHVTGRRFLLADILLYPALVQGAEAPMSLCRGLEYFNIENNVDVIIIGRGGGSIEDLWCFNDESVVRAVAASHIPVISAVGHETDFTLCDFAADRRAPTPSAAAEIAVPDTAALQKQMASITDMMNRSMMRRMQVLDNRLRAMRAGLEVRSPQRQWENNSMRLSMAGDRLDGLMKQRMQTARTSLGTASARLELLSPLAVLARGYAMAENEEGHVLSSTAMVSVGDGLTLRLSDGAVNATVTKVRKDRTQ